jgi:hypothetical protein
MTIAETAAAWLATATPDQIRAFEAFRAEGCLSCGDKATPGCPCWRIREPEYLKVVATERAV